MKRLTTDDQERIMRSRALPEDFDLSQSLHPGSRRPSERPVPSLSSLTLREPSVNQRPNLTLNQDYGNMPPGSMSSVYGSPSPITGSASGSGNLSPASPYSGSHFSEGLSPVAATSRHDQLSRSNSLSVASQASQQQSGLSSRGGMGLMRAGTFPASEQQIPLSAGVPSPYNDNDPGIYQRAPLQSPDAYSSRQLQHASTYPQRSNLMPTQQSISPLTSPNPLLYERPLIKYPQAPGIPGYYTASYTQNIEFTGPWQAPTPVGGNPLSQGPRYLSDTEFTSDPNVYDQFASQRGQVGPLAQYIAVQPAESSQYEYAAPSGDFPITPGRRRGGRGNTYPNYYNPS